MNCLILLILLCCCGHNNESCVRESSRGCAPVRQEPPCGCPTVRTESPCGCPSMRQEPRRECRPNPCNDEPVRERNFYSQSGSTCGCEE